MPIAIKHQRSVIRHQYLMILSILFALSFIHLAHANSLNSLRLWTAPENTRVVFDLADKPNYSYFSLKNPQRLVIDFKHSKNNLKLIKKIKLDSRIKRIRTSTSKNKHDTRIVIELAKRYKLRVFALAPAGQYTNRLVIDLYDKNVVVHTIVKNNNQQRDIIIGIDAGHGGEDPGSIGAHGSYEKRITLAIAKKLKRFINHEKGLHAVMTRSGDYYVNLNRRTQIARKKKVDFLVSIHADAFRSSKPSGSSVWLGSTKRVETEMANWLVNREKNSELLGGGGDTIKTTRDVNLAFTLADLSKEHSLEVSRLIANSVIRQLKKVTVMHKRSPQHASLAVLKASDFPSILVETGFISNRKEEKQLNSKMHQQKIAHAIFIGVKKYFLNHPPRNTYYAAINYKKHRVALGESLSTLSHRYQVSVQKIKLLNNLSSNMVRIGQTLKIPRAG